MEEERVTLTRAARHLGGRTVTCRFDCDCYGGDSGGGGDGDDCGEAPRRQNCHMQVHDH